MPPGTEAYFRSARRLVGRKSELSAVLAAIESSGSGTSVILFEGQGGIGKTRLLVEAHELCDERDVLCTEVIDLYLTRYHSPARLMFAVASQLQQHAARRGIEGQLFAKFLNALESLYSSMGEGSDDQRRQIERVFLDEYQALAGNYKLVLLVDTLEKLHPAIPDAQEFDFRQVGRLENWLASILTQLPNTVVMLAGRPRARQRELFATILGQAFTSHTVEPFTLEETAEYINTEFAGLAEMSQEQIATLHTISAGRPVVLAIALACAQREIIDITALPAEFEQEYPKNRDQLSDAFVRLIIEDLYNQRPDLAQMLARAVYLRKGLRVSILEQIVRDEGANLDSAELGVQLEELASFVFVKRIDKREIILHDEMYELLLGKIGDQQAAAWWRSAILYLDQQIASVIEQLQSSSLSTGDAPRVSHASLQQKLQTLQVERMFYEMSIDLRRGYQIYRELSSNSIAARDEDFDAQLQEELARFFDTEMVWGRLYRQRLLTSGFDWDRIIYDEGIRWVYRRINAHVEGADRYSQAVGIAVRVRERYRTIYEQQLLARCDLDSAQLQAEVYIHETTPRGAQISQNYQRLMTELEGVIAATPVDDPDGAYARFILANAYNYWGYYERIQDRLQSASDKYKAAIRLYRQLGPEVDGLHAVTLNNLGYALARQGESERGLICLAHSLGLVQRTGAVYRIATTYNTQAHLFTDLGQLDKALYSVLEARRLFAQFNSIRAKALNANAEGRIRSRLAEAQADERQRDEEYEQAVVAYGQAITEFDKEGELSRRIEARSSLAKTLRDRASTRANAVEAEADRDEAFRLLEEALALTTEKTPRILCCAILEAMAAILVDKGAYAEAHRLLEEARALLPASLQDPTRFGESAETTELRIYWLRFAQIELQCALAAFPQKHYQEACAHLLRAFTGLIAFSPDASPIERFRSLARRALLTIGDRDAIAELQIPMRAAAYSMRAPAAAVTIVDRLLAQAMQTIEDIDLFGS